MIPAAGVLGWDPAAPPFDPRDTSGRDGLSCREVAERFIQLFYVEDNPRDAFMAWMHPDYIQHNPNAPTGRDATAAVLDAAVRNNPELTHNVKRLVYGAEADGEAMVVIHHHFRRQHADRGFAVIDILRVNGGYIVEHWDVMQPVPDPAEAKNANSMF